MPICLRAITIRQPQRAGIQIEINKQPFEILLLIRTGETPALQADKPDRIVIARILEIKTAAIISFLYGHQMRSAERAFCRKSVPNDYGLLTADLVAGSIFAQTHMR